MNKSAILTALGVVLRHEYNEGLKHREPTWPVIAMKIPSTTSMNTFAWMGAFPQMREWVGERQIKKMNTEAMAIKNKLFEATVGIPRTDIEDDQVGIYRPIMRQAGVSAAELPDRTWELLPDGNKTKCYDGQNFFDAEHPRYANEDGTGAVTPQSNLTIGKDIDTPTWYVVDDTNVIKPLIWQERCAPEFETKFDPSRSDKVFMEDIYLWGIRARGNAGFGLWQLAHAAEKTALTKENLAKVVATMKNLKGDGGKTLKTTPSLLIVPPALEEAASVILKQSIQDGTTNIWAGRLKLHVEPNLS